MKSSMTHHPQTQAHRTNLKLAKMEASTFAATSQADLQELLIWFIIKAVYADTVIVKTPCLHSLPKTIFLVDLPVKVQMNAFLIDLADFKPNGL